MAKNIDDISLAHGSHKKREQGTPVTKESSPLHAVKRLRNRMAQLTLTLGLADYQRAAIAREFDEWTARELGRLWKESR